MLGVENKTGPHGRKGDWTRRHAVSWALGALVLGASMVGTGTGVSAADTEPVRTIVIKNHRFEPAVVEVPARVRVKLVIDNQDATPEEFESHDLRREKLAVGHSKIIVWVGPLPKGTYGFYGDFHQKTAQGKLIAK